MRKHQTRDSRASGRPATSPHALRRQLLAQGRRLCFESLEQRRLLSVTPTLSPPATVTFLGNAAGDHLYLQTASHVLQYSQDGINFTSDLGDGQTLQISSATQIIVELQQANNVLSLAPSLIADLGSSGAGLSYDGGKGGSGSLMVEGGTYQQAVFTASGPGSGTVTLDGGTVTYSDLAPITLGGTAANVTVNLSPANDVATLASGGGQITVQSNSGTFESLTFPAPTASLAVNGGGGVDTVTDAGITLAVSGSIAVNADTIAVSGGSLQAASISLIASASASDTPPPATVPFNESPSAAASIIINGGAQITTSGDLTLNASSNVTSTLTSQSLSIGQIDSDAAAARNNVTSTASAHVSDSTLNIGGTLNVVAGNVVNVSTTADGSAGGATAIGACGALSSVDATTTALVDGAAAVNAGEIQISSSSDTQVATVAIAAKEGALNNAGTPTTAQQLLGAYTPATANGSLTVAAAVAVSDVTSTTTAGLASTAPVVSAGSVAIVSSPLTESSAKGDARTVNGATGVGAAVGLNIVDATGTASLGKGLQATSLSVQATTPTGYANTLDAEAYSGAGSTAVGVAGALALNTVSHDSNQALLAADTNAILAGNLQLLADNASRNDATASGLGGISGLGVGGSVALNIADTSAGATITSGAATSGVNVLTLDAQSDPAMLTTAFSGATGGTATAAAVGLAIPSGATQAEIGSGSPLSLGTLIAEATTTTTTTTTVDGKSAGSGVGVGADFGLTIANESAATSVARNVTTTGNVTLSATMDAADSTTALAGDEGAAPGSTAVNDLITQWTTFLAGENWAPAPANLPQAATPSGPFGVAAAVAITLAGPTATVSVAAGAAIDVGGEEFSDSATNTYLASAIADATAIDDLSNVATAVAIDVATPGATATIAGSVTASSVTFTATLSGDSTATADSGAGSTNVGVAGALAINVGDGTSQANLPAGSAVTSNAAGGNVTVQAFDTPQDTATADATAIAGGTPVGDVEESGGIAGVGASVALNISSNTAEADVAGSITSAAGLTVLASSNPIATATANGGAAGGTAVAPALALTVATNLASTFIAGQAVLAVAGDMLLRALERSQSQSTARGGAVGSKTAVGASLGVNIDTGSAESVIAGQANVTGSATIEAELDAQSSASGYAGALGAPAGTTDANTLVANLLTFAQDPSRNWVSGTVSVPAADEPGGVPAVAAAVAVNVDLSQSSAQIDSTGNVRAGTLFINGKSNVNATATASGRTVDNSLKGFGIAAAVAVNVGAPTTQAVLAGTASAKAVTVQTLMSGEGPHIYDAEAYSGAGANASDLAGALAVNVGLGTSEARIDDTAVVNLSGAATLQVTANYLTDNLAHALSTAADEGVVGLGASLAVNTAINYTHAVIGAAAINGAQSIAVQANAAHAVTTTAQAGARTDASFGVSLAVGVSRSNTTAEMLPGGAALAVGGTVNVAATHTNVITTTADAKTAGASVGAGAAIAVTVALDGTTAQVARNLVAGGKVSIAASSTETTSAAGQAGQNGGFGSLMVDQQVDNALGLPVATVAIPPLLQWADIYGNGAKDVQLSLPTMGAAAAISVNVAQPSTQAQIADNTSVTSTKGTVSVTSSVQNQATSTGDGSAVGNSAGIAMVLAGNLAGGQNQASVGAGASVTATTISVNAHEAVPQTFTVSAQTGTGALLGGVAGSIALNAGAVTTQAEVGDGATLVATQGVTIAADSNLVSVTTAGGAALGLAAGGGASISGTLMQHLTVASIGNAQVDAPGEIAVTADATQNLAAAAVAGAAAGLASVAGSITLNSLVATTKAVTGVGAQLDQHATANPAQNILVHAEDDTTVLDGSGVISGALLASGSAVVDASVVQKNTLAILGGKVNAGGNITVEALSTETVTSVTGNAGMSLLISIAGSGSVAHLDVTTQAYVDSGAAVLANGSIRIAADDESTMNLTADSASFGGVGVGAGASLAVGWVTKVTEAFIAGPDTTRSDPFNPSQTLGGAQVTAEGNQAITADTGAFDVTFGPEGGYGQISPPLGSVAAALSAVTDNPILQAVGSAIKALLGLIMIVDAPPIDQALTQDRSATPATDSMSGLAITATTRDSMKRLARGVAGSVSDISVSPELSGSAALVANTTSAFVAAGAQATSNKFVRIVAASDTYDLGIGGSAAAGGLAVLGAAANLSLFNNLTQAYVAGHVEAQNDVDILAKAEEDVVAVAAGISVDTSSFGLNLTASLPVVSVGSAARAFVDKGGFVHSVGNTLISAEDDTATSVIAGQASFGASYGLGVGASAGVTLINKDTRAYIAGGATVNADGNTADTITVFDGSVATGGAPFPTEAIHGLGVQASSSETTLNVASAGSGGSGVDIEGSLGFQILASNTSAYIDTGATVNTKNLNVSAANDPWTFGAAVNLSYNSGLLSISGAVDLGLFRNNTFATISGNITASGNVEVHALSQIKVDSFVGALGFTTSGVSAVISAGLYSIRANFDPIFGIIPLDILNIDPNNTLQQQLDAQIFNLSSKGGGGIADLLNRYAGGVSGGQGAANAIAAAAPSDPATSNVNPSPITFNPATAVDNNANTINLGAGNGLTTGDRVDYSAGEDKNGKANTAIGGLQDGATYYVSVDPNNPDLVQLYNTRQDAVDGVNAIALDNSKATGTTQSLTLVPDTGTQARINGGTVHAGGNVEVNGQETIQAAMDSSFTFNFDPSDSSLLNLSNNRTILVTGGESGGWIQGGAVVTAGGDVTVQGDADNTQQLSGDTAVDGTKNIVAAAIEDATVSAPHGSVDVDASSNTSATYTALLPAYNATLQTKSPTSSMASTIDAHIAGGAQVTAGNDVQVTAKDRGKIFVVADSATFKTSGFAVAASIVTNDVADTVTAYTDDSTVTATSGTVALQATSYQDIESYSIGVAAESGGKFAGAGSVALSNVANSIDTYIKGGDVTAEGDVSLLASDEDGGDQTTILSVSGGAAVTLGTAALGVGVSTNTIANSIAAHIEGGTVTSKTGAVTLEADTSATIETLAIGLGLSSKFSVDATVTLNDVESKIDAHIAGGADVTGQSDVKVDANDTSSIHSLAGGAAGALGAGAVGASVANNELGNSDPTKAYVTAYIDGSTVTATTGIIEVKATSTTTIETLAIGLAGADSFAAGGSVTLNTINDNIIAAITNAPQVTAAGTVTVAAEDSPTITSGAGYIAVASSVAIGASVALNDIGGEDVAKIESSTVTSTSGSVAVQVDSTNGITDAAIGGGGAGTVGIAGSVAVNTIEKSADAHIHGGAVTAANAVTVIANTTNSETSVVGTLTLGGTAGIGGSAVITTLKSQTKAYIDGGAQVRGKAHGTVSVPLADGSGNSELVGGVVVIAQSTEDLKVYTANLAGGGTVGVAATVSIEIIGDTTQAYIDGSTVNANNASDNRGQGVRVRALNVTHVDTNAGGLAAGGTAGVGATCDVELLGNTTQTYLADSAQVNARAGVQVTAYDEESVLAIVVSGAGAGAVAVAGNVPIINVSSTTETYVQNSTVTAGGDLDVTATSDVRLGSRKNGSDTGLIAGGLAVGGGVGVGGSVVVATIATTTKAHITSSTTNAAGTTSVQANSLEDVKTYDITLAGGFYVGAAGSVIVTTIKPNTEAFIDGTSLVNQDPSFSSSLQAVSVQASDNVTATDLAGAAAGGIVGVSASIDVLTIRNATAAYIDQSATVSSGGDVTVQATQARNVTSTVIGFGGGLVGVQGSISIVNIGSAMSSDGSAQAANTQSAVTQQMQGADGMKVDMVGSDPVATSAEAQANSMTSALDVSQDFDTTAPAAPGTSASILGTVHAKATINVTATDGTELGVTGGSIAVGLVGAGAAVAIANIDTNTAAFIAGSGMVSAGREINIKADFGLNKSGNNIAQAYAGAGGFGGLAGAIVLVTDNSTQSAYVGGSTQITNAVELNVTATSERTMNTSTGEVAVGVVAGGAAVAKATAQGSTTADINGSAQVGQQAGHSVGSVALTADADTVAGAKAVAIAAGIGAGSGNDAEALIQNQTIEASVGQSAQVKTTGNVDLESISQARATAQAIGVNAGGLAVGVSLTTATISPSVKADVAKTADVVAGGNLTLRSLHNTNTDGSPIANSGATATSFASAGGALAGVTVGSASASENPSLDTYVDSGATVQAGGNIELDALSTNIATSTMEGFAGGTLGIGVGTANAAAGGESNSNSSDTEALMDGTVNGGQDLTVNANSSSTANATSFGFSGGLASVNVVEANANAIPTVDAWIDGGVTISGQATAEATAVKNATAESTGLTIGGVAVGGMTASASTTSPTAAEVNGSMTAGSLQVLATDTEDAQAHVKTVGVGGLSVQGAQATSDASGPVQASIGSSANLAVTHLVDVNGTSSTTSTADVGGATVALVGVSGMAATATLGGSTQALVSGTGTAGSLTVAANDGVAANNETENASGTANVADFGLLSGQGAAANATVTRNTQADVDTTGLTVNGASSVAATSNPDATAETDGTGGSVVASVSFMQPTAQAAGNTTAYVNGTLSTAGLSVTATANRSATATTNVVSVGIIGGGQADGEANATVGDPNNSNTGNTQAYIAGTSDITATGAVPVYATSTSQATASASGGGGGLLYGGASISADDTVDGSTAAFVDNGATIENAGDLDLHAKSNSAGNANSQAGTGGAFSAGGSEAYSTVAPTTTAYIGTGVQVVHAGFVSVEAESDRAESHATANVNGGGIVQVGHSTANSTSTPAVSASIGQNSTVQSDTYVAVQALSYCTPVSGTSPGNPGDGAVDATATGGGGGGVAVDHPKTTATMAPTVSAYIAAQLVNAGGNVTIASESDGNLSAFSNNSSGGFVAISNADATTNFDNTNNAFVGQPGSQDGSGIQINAGGNFKLSADSELPSDEANARADIGGGVSSNTANSTTNVDNQSGNQTQALIGANAQITAQTVDLAAEYSHFHSDAETYAKGTSLTGSATGNTYGAITPNVAAVIQGNGNSTNVAGIAGVDISALIADVSVIQNPDATFIGIGPVNHDSHVVTSPSLAVIGQPQATVLAGPRIFAAPGVPPQDVTPLATPAGSYPKLALYVQTSAASNVQSKYGPGFSPNPTITWDSNVILASGPSPTLVVDANGRIAEAINVSVQNVGSAIGSNVDPGNTGSFAVANIINNAHGQALFQGNSNTLVKTTLTDASLNGPLFTFRETYASVSLVNQSTKSMTVNNVTVVNTTTPSVHDVTLDANNVSGFEFNVNHDFKPTTVTIQNTYGGAAHAPNIVVAGGVDNPIGITDLSDAHGNITSSGGGLIRTDLFALQAPQGSIGVNAAGRLRLQTVESNDGPAAPAGSARTVDALGNVFMDIQSLLRRPLTGSEYTTGFVTHIDHVTAGGTVDLTLEQGLDERSIRSFTYTIHVDETKNVHNPDAPNPYPVTDHFRKPPAGNTPTILPGGIFGAGTTAINVDYDFGTAADPAQGILAGGNINVVGPTAIAGPFAAVTGYIKTPATGHVDVLTGGFITLTEKAGNLRIDQIASGDKDVTLVSPQAIVDATNHANGANVTGVNITLTAGTACHIGGIGVPADFLEINVNELHGSGPALGVLTATDTRAATAAWNRFSPPSAPAAAGTLGIFVTQVALGAGSLNIRGFTAVGDLDVGTVNTKGDISLATQAGSIVDARNGGVGADTASVIGNTIDLYAKGGSIGAPAGGNDLEIDAQHYAAGTIGARADLSLFLSETAGEAPVVLLQAAGPDQSPPFGRHPPAGGEPPALRFTVRQSGGPVVPDLAPDTATLDTGAEDLNLLASGSVLFVQNAVETIRHGLINAMDGSILLRVGDDITTDPNSQILAAQDINIYGDFRRVNELSSGVAVTEADDGDGTIMHLRGTIAHGLNNSTRIFGNANADQFFFDQTFLGGLNAAIPGGLTQVIPYNGGVLAGAYPGGTTRVYGSNTPTPAAAAGTTAYAPAGDGDDAFTVNQLQTMNVRGGDTLTLDGQAGGDTYVVNTAASQAKSPNYVIDVFDTGAPGDGVNALAVTGPGPFAVTAKAVSGPGFLVNYSNIQVVQEGSGTAAVLSTAAGAAVPVTPAAQAAVSAALAASQSGNAAALAKELAWLYAYTQMTAGGQSSAANNSTKEAIDAVLVMDWS